MARKKYVEDYLEIDFNELKRSTKKTKKNNVLQKLNIQNKKVIASICIVSIVLGYAVIDFVNDIVNESMTVSVNANTSDDIVSNIIDMDRIDASNNAETQKIILEEKEKPQYIILDNSSYNFINSLKQTYTNDNIKLFLSIISDDGTINYGQPVVQTVNNSYYLDHSLTNQFNKNGSAFLDNSIIFEEIPENLVIYGNDLYEETPFYNIQKYKNIDFFNQNKIIKIETEYGVLEYEAIAFVEENNSFHTEPTSFENEEAFLKYINEISSKSIYPFYNVEYGDKILTISTSSNKSDGNRYKLYGKIIEQSGI